MQIRLDVLARVYLCVEKKNLPLDDRDELPETLPDPDGRPVEDAEDPPTIPPNKLVGKTPPPPVVVVEIDRAVVVTAEVGAGADVVDNRVLPGAAIVLSAELLCGVVRSGN